MVDLVHAPVRNLENIVENAARGLVRTNHRSAESFVSVPLFYPSGSGTTLSVTLERNGLRVSDLSAAYQEVKMVGAETGFTRKASRVSERLGLELLAHSVTALLSEANLASAISDVASASTEIANYLVERTAGREEAEISAHLLEKLRNIFGQSRITPLVQVKGVSGRGWGVTAVVRAGLRNTQPLRQSVNMRALSFRRQQLLTISSCQFGHPR